MSRLRTATALATLVLLGGCGSRVGAGEVLAAQQREPAQIVLPSPAAPQSTAKVPTEPTTRSPAAPAPKAAAPHPVAPKRQAAPATPGRVAEARPVAAAVTPDAGVSADRPCASGLAPIRLGQVGHFSGVLGPLTAGARSGLAVWSKDVNARGGLACHPVQLFSVDDGADPARTSAAVQDLVQSKKVAALVGTFSPLTAAALQQSAERFKVPVIGGDVLSYSWHQSPYMFPQGASLKSQAYGLVRHTAQSGHPKIALLYCVETSTCTTLHREIEGDLTRRAGATLVYSAPVTLVATDYTSQCQNAKNAGAEALGLALDGSAMARVVRSCEALGYRPPIFSSAFNLGPIGAADPSIRRNGMFSENITAPWMRSDTPGQRAYLAAMRAYAAGQNPESGSILAWTAGKLVEAAVARLGSAAQTAVDAPDLLRGLGKIRGERLDGLTPPLTFRPGGPAPDVRCLYFTTLGPSGWSAPSGSHPVCPD